MNKKTLITGLFVLVIAGMLAVVIIGSNHQKVKNSQAETKPSETAAVPENSPIFFYGNTCPHCADVEAWMKENQIEAKVELVKKEVYDNQSNALELTRAAQTCNLDTDSIGVPFLYTPDRLCLIGTPDITQYLTDLVERRTE